MKKKILVIAAHPDDEVLGCGGTIAKHSLNKDFVEVMILGEGITSRSKIRNTNLDKKKLLKLKEITLKANKTLGVKKVIFGDLPDNRFDELNILDVIKIIEEVIFKFKPNIIYTHSGLDLNRDHKITNEAVLTACRPQQNYFFKNLFSLKFLRAQNGQVQKKNNFHQIIIITSLINLRKR